MSAEVRAAFLGAVCEVVSVDRNSTHGEPENNFDTIAKLWSAYLGVPVNAQQVGWMMVLFKAARAKANQNNTDNVMDAAGYLACIAPMLSDNW